MISIKILLLFVVTILGTSLNAHADDCNYWRSLIDPAIRYNGPRPNVEELTNADKIRAIGCLLSMQGQHGDAKFSGVTRLNISQVLPKASIEVAALYYISYLYCGKWGYSDGIALVDKYGKFNTKRSVKLAYKSYNDWYKKVLLVGLDKMKERRIDPLDNCDGVHWFGYDPDNPGLWDHREDEDVRKILKLTWINGMNRGHGNGEWGHVLNLDKPRSQ